MDYPLQFGRQTWKPHRDGDLTLFLPSRTPFGMPFHADFAFVPPWLEEDDYESEHRTMYLTLAGYFPAMKHWEELEGFTVESRDAVEAGDEVVATETKEPEIHIWSSGQGPGSIHTHAQDGWQTRLSLEEFAKDDAHTFICEVEAFFPSERARQAMSDLWFRDFFGGMDFGDDEREKLLEEGWRFTYRGRLRLEHLSCTVPLNAANPVALARRMAERELGMREFGFCRVNGGEMDGTFKPEHGVSAQGRLVLLSPPSEFFTEWQQREEDRKKKGQGEKDT